MSNYFVDLAERVGFSYLYALVTLELTNGLDYTDLSAQKVAALAAIPAALAVIKGALAKFLGKTEDTAGFTS